MTDTKTATPAAAKTTTNASRWLWISVVVIGIDQLTKWLIVENFELYDTVRFNAIFNLTRLHNTGAAFSLLQNESGWQRFLFIGLATIVSIVILVWLRRMPAKGQTMLAIALALVLGGALGNVIDRVHYFYVVDFLQFHWKDAYFPTFNVADIAISIGAFLLILDSFFGSGRSKKEPLDNADEQNVEA